MLAGGLIGLVNGPIIAGLHDAIYRHAGHDGCLCAVRPSGWLAIKLSTYHRVPLNHLMALVSPTTLLPLPPGVWIAIGLALVVSLLMRRTVFGRYIFAIGSNEATARLCGIRVPLQKVLIYSLAGLFFWSGRIDASVTTHPRRSDGGHRHGAGHHRGRGDRWRCFERRHVDILGSMIGALIMAVLRNGSNQMGWQNFTQEIIIGGVIMAVGLDQFRQSRMRT